MRRIHVIAIWLMLFFILVQLSACQKIIDSIFPGHADNNYKACRIEHIKGHLSPDEEVIGTVEYNDANNPVSLIYNKVLAYYLSLRYLYYDSANRLIEYKVMFDSTTELETHRYRYEGDRIVSDTATLRLTGYIVILSTFEYDSKGRISVENRKIIDFEGSPDTWEKLDPTLYEYDSNDNLVLNKAYTYDDRINFRRTNKVWMFITRNYSRNNLVGATAYNEQDLPVRFNNSDDFLFEVGSLISIDYDCR